jgi:thiamine pyrophosphokinase
MESVKGTRSNSDKTSSNQEKISENTQEEVKYRSFLVIAGGREPSHSWLKRTYEELGGESLLTVLCADKGLEYAVRSAIPVDYAFGDGDSCDFKIWSAMKNKQVVPCEKDYTDLQLAIQNVQGAGFCMITGVWGGRFDQLYANVQVLIDLKKKQKCLTILADEKERMIILTKGEALTLELKKNETDIVSVLSFTPEAKINITGTKWVLNESGGNLIKIENPYTISNESLGGKVRVACFEGVVGFYIKSKE